MTEQTRARPRETLEYKMNKQMITFSISPPIPLVEEGKWVMAVTSSGAIVFVFNMKNENNILSFSILSYWFTRGDQRTIIRMKESLVLRDENDIE